MGMVKTRQLHYRVHNVHLSCKQTHSSGQ